MKLNINAFAIACAIVWGVGIFAATWWIILLDGPGGTMPLLSSIYRGFSVTPLGSLIGLLWALVDGYVAGAIFAWLYNRFLPRLAAEI